ncbi:hypothetical protein [Streptomyces sp. NPDC006012]|uniref:hypothetical protein n=1 Tax=Streptomyces sp. NPDC006012 TaxID=3364739 RepID=UPI0036782005
MPPKSFYTEEQRNKMRELKDLQSANKDRSAGKYTWDGQTTQMESDAKSWRDHFKSTAESLDRSLAEVHPSNQKGRSAELQMQFQQWFADVQASHINATDQWLEAGLAYERRRKAILNQDAGAHYAAAGPSNNARRVTGHSQTPPADHTHRHRASRGPAR